MKQYTSIFNDVIGPVMRGPSSSHTAASIRIGQLIRQMVQSDIIEFVAEFDPDGSLATTYHSQCSDIGLIGGILGMDTSDDNLLDALNIAEEKNIKISFDIVKYNALHPNTYKIHVKTKNNEEIGITALSLGGGTIEICEVNGFDTEISGGFHELLIYVGYSKNKQIEIIKREAEELSGGFGNIIRNNNKIEILLNIKSCNFISDDVIKKIKKIHGINSCIYIKPILPIRSQLERKALFTTLGEMLKYNEDKNLKLYELASEYESLRGSITKEEVIEKMSFIVDVMIKSVKTGLKGTKYEDRMLGFQSKLIKQSNDNGNFVGGNVINSIMTNITAIMEVKSSMGVVVAAPTAGSCGGLPGTVIGVATHMSKGLEDIVKAMLSAGMIGVFIAEKSTFAAEVGGCQAECGSGSGMAAAAIVELMGGSTSQAIDASSMALQNILGMVCDPVAGRVEVPCLGKNIMCGLNALACANMVMAGCDKVIPLEETILAMNDVGRMIPSQLRCTGKGGLSVTKTSIDIGRKLK